MVFGLPMAFSMTVLAWSIIEYGSFMNSGGQLSYALEALKWGTDFIITCHPSDNVFWMQVGYFLQNYCIFIANFPHFVHKGWGWNC